MQSISWPQMRAKHVSLGNPYQHLVNANHHPSNCYCCKTLMDQISSWCKLDQSQFKLLEIWLLIFSVFALHASVTCIHQLPRSMALGCQIIWQESRLLLLKHQWQLKGAGMLLIYFLNWKIWNEM